MSVMKSLLLVGLVTAIPLAKLAFAAAPHETPAASGPMPVVRAGDDITSLTQNQLYLTVSNIGSFGNLFSSRAASLEYPGTSGYEHLTIAGLWIGARTKDGGGEFTGVSIAAQDGSQGLSTAAYTEFTASAPSFIRRSTYVASPWYDPAAVSELDLICSYADTPARNGTIDSARPLRVSVRQSAYAWRTNKLRDVVFVRYVIAAQGDTLRDVWVGHYAEMASGNKGAYVNWPPSSADPSGMGGWFNKKLVIYEPAQRLLREHYCRNQPVPAGCMFSIAPPWIGLQLLTPPSAGQSVTVAAWPWSPGTPPHNNDAGRYGLMSAGTIADFTSPDLAPGTGDPVEVLALGPFPVVAPGDSVTVDFAWVGGADEEAIRAHARSAQVVRDAGFNPGVLGVEPPDGALELRMIGIVPNPARGGRMSLAFELPTAGTATAQLFDLAGRKVLERRWSDLGAGLHTVPLATPRLAPGVYVVRMSSMGRTASGRVVLLE